VLVLLTASLALATADASNDDAGFKPLTSRIREKTLDLKAHFAKEEDVNAFSSSAPPTPFQHSAGYFKLNRTSAAVGRCALTHPDPQLKGARYPGGLKRFQPLHLSREKPASRSAFQMQQLAPLRRGDVLLLLQVPRRPHGPRGTAATQVDSS
jgi:hypothetical protein